MNYNPAIRFDGISDFLNTPLSINYNTMPDATIITVYKPDKNSAGAVWGEDNAGWDRFLLDGNTTTLNNMVSEGGGSNLNINQLFNTAEVHLTSVAYDQGLSNGSQVYVNGVNQRTFTANQTTASSLLQIGALGSNNYPFDGDIGEVFVYNSILSATERQKVGIVFSYKVWYYAF